ncbi:hypothetical protein BDV28DRAFT_140915 [Aspergillus coremiiformis]|uniref:Uncharacterized protein n=1 Tax=Aspergillus coremiiformis TaxID=138285 RepID=A0A5N6YVV7_9EURO|nr:hypothetical protein BDV28DRAFT_140915 [Aspergillus coremiiformis]
MVRYQLHKQPYMRKRGNTGWLHRFQSCRNIKNRHLNSELALGEAAAVMIGIRQALRACTPQDIFNCDETGPRSSSRARVVQFLRARNRKLQFQPISFVIQMFQSVFILPLFQNPTLSYLYGLKYRNRGPDAMSTKCQLVDDFSAINASGGQPLASHLGVSFPSTATRVPRFWDGSSVVRLFVW